MNTYKACHCCGLIHRLPPLAAGQTAECVRCRTLIRSAAKPGANASRTAAAALGAFVLFWPAILLPILEIERLGHHSESSILVGIGDLFRHGSWFVGSVVLVFSIIFPLVKILFLLELSFLRILHRRYKALTYRIMEHAGKWSMMDVLLLAFMVMLVKLGDLVTFHFGYGVVAFTLCVAMSLIASVSFDPHAIWEKEEA